MILLILFFTTVACLYGISTPVLAAQTAQDYSLHNFSMPIDHFQNDPRYAPHTSAVFQQRYWLDVSYYQPGGPVLVFTMGEDTDDLFELSLLGGYGISTIANATNALIVQWPQRYYAGGDIVPPDSPYTTENLRFHSTQQALADLAYFSQRVSFAGFEHCNLTASEVPWILIGGSYGGVISAFSRIQYPHLFWGALSSSGVTTAYLDNWQSYDVVRRYAEPSCVYYQQRLISIANTILRSSNSTLLDLFFEAFGIISPPTSFTDFAETLSSQLNYVPPLSQLGPGSYCYNITTTTVLEPTSATINGTAETIIGQSAFANDATDLLPHVLNWFASIRHYLTVECTNCVSYTNPPSPYDWLVCTESGQFETGYAPGTADRPSALSLATTLENVDEQIEGCRRRYNFSSSYTGPNLTLINQYGGINLSFPRLALSTGEYDRYRPLQPLAQYDPLTNAPNPRATSNGTLSEPQIIISAGQHEQDLSISVQDSEAEFHNLPAIVSAHYREVEAVQLWLREWNTAHRL